MPSPGSRQAAYNKAHPWVRYVEYARRRCRDRNSKWFKYYGAKGICCDLNAKDAEILWVGAKAWKLVRPSLDRIDPANGYTLSNCRFIEFDLNARMGWDPKSRPKED